MADLTNVQRILIACDDYITNMQIKGPKTRDRACAQYLSGVLATLRIVGGTDSPPEENAIFMINCGGYPRIHRMAEDARVMERS